MAHVSFQGHKTEGIARLKGQLLTTWTQKMRRVTASWAVFKVSKLLIYLLPGSMYLLEEGRCLLPQALNPEQCCTFLQVAVQDSSSLAQVDRLADPPKPEVV